MPSSFDRAGLEQWARQQWGYQVDDVPTGDGPHGVHYFERGLGWAFVALEQGELMVASHRIGPPSDGEFHAWLRIQSELISSLRERFPFLPPEATWQLSNSYLDAELAATAHESRGGQP